MSVMIDLTGKKFGKLTVESFAKSNGKAHWKCSCECGGTAIVEGNNLRNGHTLSCGCVQKERASKAKKTHGCTGTKTYRTWQSMHRRCADPKNKDFRNYGGRGIAVCDRWKVFENFLFDMGKAPAGMHIDRIDTNSNYEPSNCRWVTPQENMNNTRRNRHLTLHGETLTVAEWSRKLSIDPDLVFDRLKRRWSVEKALTLPARQMRRVKC